MLSFEGYYFGNGDVTFRDVKFGDGNVTFRHANFGNGTSDFSGASFGDGRLIFSAATFGNGGVIFYQVKFGKGVKDFSETVFGTGEVNFLEADFDDGHINFFATDFGNGDVLLTDTTIGSGQLILAKACASHFLFSPKAHKLTAISARGLVISQWGVLMLKDGSTLETLDFQGASFDGAVFISGDLDIVPDLRRIRSSHQIELGELKIELRRLSHYSSSRLLKYFSQCSENVEDSGRLRRLKEIAEANKDHQAALRFSADENRASRWIQTSKLGSILDIAFSGFSNYGQSILRPFCWLAGLLAIGTSLYKFMGTNEHPIGKPEWWGDLGQAIALATSNSLPFLPQSRGIRDDAIKALYSNDPSLLIDAIMIGHGALSFIFLFLIGLGLRNRFRL